MPDCVHNCRCGRHKLHQTAQRPNREARRRQRVQSSWRDTPSEHFDYAAATRGLHRVFDRVYGAGWRDAPMQTMTDDAQPPFGYCENCRAPLWDLICPRCGEVYD